MIRYCGDNAGMGNNVWDVEGDATHRGEVLLTLWLP